MDLLVDLISLRIKLIKKKYKKKKTMIIWSLKGPYYQTYVVYSAKQKKRQVLIKALREINCLCY